MSDVSVPVWAVVAAAAVAVVLVLLVGVVLLVALTGRTRAERRLSSAAESEAELRERLESLERRLATPSRRRQRSREEREYVITSLGDGGTEAAETAGGEEQTQVRTLTAPAFADAVFRETMVHSAAFVHGVRRALSPEVRYRIRYEMKREVKRARKDRRSEVRDALREYRARQRDDLAQDDSTLGSQPRHRADGADPADLQEESR